MPDVSAARFSAPSPVFELRDELGNLIDLTGSTLKYAAKRLRTDPDSSKLFDVACTPDGDQVTNKGRYSIPLTAAQTQIPAGSYPSELRFWGVGIATTKPPQRTEFGSFTTSEPVISTET